MTTLGNDVYACVDSGDIYKVTVELIDSRKKTYNIIAGLLNIDLSDVSLGEPKTFRKISSDTNVITITLPTGHTFSGGGQSITLTNQYEEVTIERVSSTVWVEKDRVEVFVITDYLNGWEAFDLARQPTIYRYGNFVHITGLIKNGTTRLPSFNIPVKFRPKTTQHLSVVSSDTATPSNLISGQLVITSAGIATVFNPINGTNVAYMGVDCVYTLL